MKNGTLTNETGAITIGAAFLLGGRSTGTGAAAA